jgi:hypothetical protein
MVSQLQIEWSTNSSKANKVKTQLKIFGKQIKTLREQNRILLGQLTRSPSSRLTRNPSPTYRDLSPSQIENTLNDGGPTMMRSSSDRIF